MTIFRNKHLLGTILCIITVVIWGITFVSTKVLLDSLTPIQIMFFRFATAYSTLWILYPKFEPLKSRKEELLFLLAALSGITLYFLAETFALNFGISSNVSIICSTAPILTAIVAHIFTHDEKLNTKNMLGTFIAFSGVILIILNGTLNLQLNPLGDLLALLSASCWAFYQICIKKIGSHYNYILFTRKTFFYGLLTLLPLFLFENSELSFEVLLSSEVLLNLLFLGVIASALCYVMWSKAVHLIGAVQSSNYIYICPVITIIAAYFVLQEQMTFFSIIGSLLVILGVYYSERPNNTKPDTHAEDQP